MSIVFITFNPCTPANPIAIHINLLLVMLTSLLIVNVLTTRILAPPPILISTCLIYALRHMFITGKNGKHTRLQMNLKSFVKSLVTRPGSGFALPINDALFSTIASFTGFVDCIMLLLMSS